MSSRWVLGLLALALAGGWTTERAVAEAGRDALLTRQSGQVEARRDGSETWTSVIASRYLASGDAGQTLRGARAQVRLQYGNVVLAVGPVTRFTVAELNREHGRARVTLGWGSIRARIEQISSGPRDRYQIVTPNAVLGAQGTEWTTHHVEVATDGTVLGQEARPDGWPETPPGHTRAAIHKGQVWVLSKQEPDVKILDPGMTIDIGPDGAILLNPFPYRAEPTGRPAIERGTTGQGEIHGDGTRIPGVISPTAEPHTGSDSGSYPPPHSEPPSSPPPSTEPPSSIPYTP